MVFKKLYTYGFVDKTLNQSFLGCADKTMDNALRYPQLIHTLWMLWFITYGIQQIQQQQFLFKITRGNYKMYDLIF